jgi:protein TonB
VSGKSHRTLSFVVYGVSVALHVALAAGAVLAPKAKKSEVVAISLAETHKPPPKKEPPPPPPPPPPSPPVKAKSAPMPVPVAESNPAPSPQSDSPAPDSNAATTDGFADLGLMMGNGSGGGFAVPVGARRIAEPPREEFHKVRTLSAAHDTCSDAPVKAKLRGALVKPTYTESARSAQIEGVVRVEITVDDQGNVLSVKVLRGLGYGLDEAAVAAAKKMAFEPGTRCGKAAVTKLTVGMRFTLQQ